MGESNRLGWVEFMGELAEALGWREAWERGEIKPSAVLAEVRRLRREMGSGEALRSRSVMIAADKTNSQHLRGPWVGHVRVNVESEHGNDPVAA